MQRGPVNWHGVATLENDPNWSELSQIPLKGHLAAQSPVDKKISAEMSKKEDIEKGHEAATAICKHVDFLMSTQNPCYPDEGNWVKPRVHLCKRHFDDI